MLLLIILFALLSAILISIRFCSGSTSSRTYGSLLSALVLSVGVTLVLGLRDLVGFTHVTLWRLVDVTFRALCHTFPVVFLVAYAVMVYARKRGRERARHAGFVPFAFSTVLVFIAMFLLIAGFHLHEDRAELGRGDAYRAYYSKMEEGCAASACCAAFGSSYRQVRLPGEQDVETGETPKAGLDSAYWGLHELRRPLPGGSPFHEGTPREVWSLCSTWQLEPKSGIRTVFHRE